MPFRQVGAGGPVDQGHMGIARRSPAERLEDLRLPRRIGEMVVAANDMGDAHVMIVDHHCKIVGRRPVAAQDHEIVEILVGEYDAALYAVLDHRLSVARRLEADRRRDPRGRLGWVAMTPRAVIARRAPLCARARAHGLQLLGARIAAIGVTLGEQLFGDLAMALRARELIDGLAQGNAYRCYASPE